MSPARSGNAEGLVVDSLDVRYGDVEVVAGLSFEVPPGTSAALVGPSGSGKSSILDVVAGLARPAAGSVRLGDLDVTGLSSAAAAAFRGRHVGLVSQSPELLDELSVVENVALSLRLEGCSRAQATRAALDTMDRLGLDLLRRRRVDEISGGQAQRVAVGRALCRTDLRLVLADEPTAALDQETAQQVTTLLLEQAAAAGAVVLLATHDPRVVEACDARIDLRGRR